jgi:hypothetical protein
MSKFPAISFQGAVTAVRYTTLLVSSLSTSVILEANQLINSHARTCLWQLPVCLALSVRSTAIVVCNQEELLLGVFMDIRPRIEGVTEGFSRAERQRHLAVIAPAVHGGRQALESFHQDNGQVGISEQDHFGNVQSAISYYRNISENILSMIPSSSTLTSDLAKNHMRAVGGIEIGKESCISSFDARGRPRSHNV